MCIVYYLDLSHAYARIFWENKVNSMDADALASYVARAPIQYKDVVLPV